MPVPWHWKQGLVFPVAAAGGELVGTAKAEPANKNAANENLIKAFILIGSLSMGKYVKIERKCTKKLRG
jgi:hypothetical protein